MVPGCAATEAVWPVAPARTLAGAVMTGRSGGATMLQKAIPPGPGVPRRLVITQPSWTEPEAPGVKVMVSVPRPSVTVPPVRVQA